MATTSDTARDARRVARNFWNVVTRNVGRLPFAEDAVAAYYCAFDRQTPMHVRATLLGALAYFVMPADAVPDILPMLGFADDAGVIALAISTIGNNILPRHREAAREALDALSRERPAA
ncbi:hypothetical protein GCM10007276_00750 [Agaricicola taiwanensis]|uniref:DUF1232 domain-containing protein n=1 Tax=Agaricicola taiwanensis TaxID=591372 RepID=A0A8J2VK55_9RHOB|nr:YkvA family protein [Agaricicola taiwanensis]GGE27418.1 hypothetical protein GCM10007276_00750 [Agaricicola taiwanensis]